jgi:hypothetical protein
MMKSGPEVSPDEVESPHAAAIEVMVLWDANVLHVSHLAPPRSFYVGDASVGEGACDYVLPSETLGCSRAALIVADGARSVVVIPPRSRGFVEFVGEGKVSLDDLVATGRARLSSAMSGAHEIELPAGAKARVELEGSALVFQVSAVNAGKRLPAAAPLESAAFAFTGLSFLMHASLIAMFAFFMPGMRSDDSEAVDRDQIPLMQKLLAAAAEREQDRRPDEAQSSSSSSEGGQGAQAKGESGVAGKQNSKETGHKYGVEGPKNNPDPHLASRAALEEAAKFGMIGLISTMSGGDPNAPTAVWGRQESSGTDERSALGNMFGDGIGESIGTGGLGLSGLCDGCGGGGRGEGTGLEGFGGLGHGAGGGPGGGIGRGVGLGRGGHTVKPPHVGEGTSVVNGRLPAEIIQRIVHQNFGRFRLCYENGLKTNPALTGRVAVKFIIDRSGAVSMTADGGSDLPDTSVVQCVVRGFGNLSFPQPDNGMVTVVYPIVFSPGE